MNPIFVGKKKLSLLDTQLVFVELVIDLKLNINLTRLLIKLNLNFFENIEVYLIINNFTYYLFIYLFIFNIHIITLTHTILFLN
jgi:hypothetical protein